MHSIKKEYIEYFDQLPEKQQVKVLELYKFISSSLDNGKIKAIVDNTINHLTRSTKWKTII